MLGKYGKNALAGRHAQGQADQYLEANAKYDRNSVGNLPNFERYVIIDVISDPSVIDPIKLSHWEHTLNVKNIKYCASAPRNSIIAKKVLSSNHPTSESAMVLYPFFPPHLALPAKPGEHVWVMFENQDAGISEIGYWMCRIVGPHFVEDVNYTHLDRQFDPSFVPGTADLFEGKDDPKYEFPNGVTVDDNGERSQIVSTMSISGDDKVYEKLLKDSDASKNIKYEPVPRYRKRPADFVIEGSNNSLLVFGTDRTGPSTNYSSDPDKGKIPKLNSDDDPKDEGSGMIDIVVGRGQTEKTSGKKVSNKIGKSELGKSAKELTEKEGDPDLKNDRSRIILSQRTKTDKNFGITKIVNKHSDSGITDADASSIVVKSDKIRLIARKDLVILVTAANESNADGSIKDNSETVDPSKCASLIIKTNGDIVFTPSEEGVIKLGGEDAKKAILCFDEKAGGVIAAGGKVIAPVPIMSTMGGFIGGGAVHGVAATKILVK